MKLFQKDSNQIISIISKKRGIIEIIVEIILALINPLYYAIQLHKKDNLK